MKEIFMDHSEEPILITPDGKVRPGVVREERTKYDAVRHDINERGDMSTQELIEIFEPNYVPRSSINFNIHPFVEKIKKVPQAINRLLTGVTRKAA
jgi:hypothetical protein